MMIIPSMDLRGGQCVRLYQGDYAKETIYKGSPLSILQTFVEKGAKTLHLVDLDAAKDPKSQQSLLIQACLQGIPLPIQVGGGIRSTKQIERYFNEGAKKVVIGTLAVTSPKRVLAWFERFGAERFVLAFDVQMIGGEVQVMTHAWSKVSPVHLFKSITDYRKAGLDTILCTDVSRDGALVGPSLDLYQTLVQHFPNLSIQASGGIRDLTDLKRLKEIGVKGAIIGRALHEGKMDLGEALSC